MIVRQSETVRMQVTKQGEATSTMAAKYQVLGVWKDYKYARFYFLFSGAFWELPCLFQMQ